MYVYVGIYIVLQFFFLPPPHIPIYLKILSVPLKEMYKIYTIKHNAFNFNFNLEQI